jgi:AcrR family transcriptional regulator
MADAPAAAPRPVAPRPSAARQAGRRGEALLGIATDHVRRFGLERTTVVAIAREAGMTHANVYRYFPSKEALVDAITADWLKELEALLQTVADAPDPADDKLERLILAYARGLRERAEAEPNLNALHLAAFSGGRLVSRRHRQRVRTLMERIIEDGVGAQLFRVRSRDKATAVILDVLHRFIDPVAVAADCEVPRDEIDLRVAAAARLVLRALYGGLL